MNRVILGTDPGNYATKIAGDAGTTILEAVVGSPIEMKMQGLSTQLRKPGGMIVTKDGQWFVGELAKLQSPDPIYPLGARRSLDLTLALILAGYIQNGVRDGDTVETVVGLPDGWMDTAEVFADKIAGRHRFFYNGEHYDIRVHVLQKIVQHAGAFYTKIINAQGMVPRRSTYRGTVGVLDIGHGTTGLATFEGTAYIQHRSLSIDRGMAQVHAALKTALEDKFEMRDLPQRMVRQALETGTFAVAGQERHINRMVTQARDTIWRTIESEMFRVWPRPKEMETILLAGRSAEQYLPLVESLYPVVELCDDAQTANAEGMRRFALMIVRNQ